MKNNPHIENNAPMSTGVKKIILVSVMVFFLGIAPRVFAQGFVPLVTIPGLTDIPAAGGLAEFFNNLYKYLIGLAAVLAVIEIIWGGLEYSTQDSISKKSDAKERIYQAIYGLILVLSPVLVFSIINPSILDLSLNLPALNLVAPPTPVNTGGSNTGTTRTLPAAVGGQTIQWLLCEGSDSCAAAKAKCSSEGGTTGEARCFDKNNTWDPNGRTDYSLLPSSVSPYACKPGLTLKVYCDFPAK